MSMHACGIGCCLVFYSCLLGDTKGVLSVKTTTQIPKVCFWETQSDLELFLETKLVKTAKTCSGTADVSLVGQLHEEASYLLFTFIEVVDLRV